MKTNTHLGSTHTLAEWTLCILTCATLLTPLLFFPDYFSPFTNAKFIGFLLLVEITLPVYLVVRFSRLHQSSLRHNPIILAILALLLAMSISALFGVDPFNSFFGNASRPTGVFFYLHLGLFVLYLQELFSLGTPWKLRLTYLVVGIGTIAALYGLLESWLLPTFVSVDGRAGSIFGNPAVFASFLILPLFFSLGCLQRSVRPYSHMFLATSLLMTSAILLTGTRSALVGLLAGVVCWMFLWARHKPLPWKSLTTGLIAFVIVMTGFVLALRAVVPSNHVIYRLTDFSDINSQARLTYWKLGLIGWFDHPFLGVGSENFYTIADQYGDPANTITTSVWPDKSHSAFIGRLMATGLVGISVYLCLLFFACRALFTSKEPAHDLWFAGLIAYLVHGFFLFETVSGLIVFFFLLAMSASQNVPKNESTHTSKDGSVRVLTVGIGILFALVLLLGFIHPMNQLLLAIGKGNRILQENTQTAMAYYQSTESLSFTWDSRLIASTYTDVLRTSIQTPNPPEERFRNLFKTAQIAFALSLTQHPLRAQDWNDLANIFLLQAIWEETDIAVEGVQAAERAIELAPFNPIPKETLGQIYTQKIAFYVANARYDDLVAVYELLVVNNPDELPLLANLAAAYAKAGQTHKAIETANLLKERDPASASAVDVFLESL
ncbi:O-antigen ligase family protein [Candidatus Uhrbacteria bacterium]|nr:O-antigen ligase family protein [Candidatus Uhrbacteria bacterium]